MIQKENNGANLKVALPMFLSTADDRTTFVFEFAVGGKDCECYIVNNEDDSCTRSAFSREGTSTDSLQGIRIRYSLTFNTVGVFLCQSIST